MMGLPAIAVAIGDPNGIGPELAVKAAATVLDEDTARLVLVGDEFVVRSALRQFAPQLESEMVVNQCGSDVALSLLPVQSLPQAAFQPGKIDAEAGRACVAYASAAIALARSGEVAAVVACPHSETSIHAAGIEFSGYPSLVAKCTGIDEDRIFLMLVGGGLRVLHATLHERLKDALDRLTIDHVEAAGVAAVRIMQHVGIAAPRIGLFGINPHAGEGGLFGDDDERITYPAAERLRCAGYDVEGPLGADLMLARRDIDVFIAMYHDQGHIPVKLLAGRNAAAFSVGADILFSSVGHGAAFDIAGTGRADPEPLLRSLRLVAQTIGQGQSSQIRPSKGAEA
jgi:4-hydroxy-L-threonine phosphate dehydrogenase PdxA